VSSPESVASRYCEQEVAHALELNKRIVPLLCRAVPDDALPDGIRVRSWIPIGDDGDFEQGVARAVDALDTDLAWTKEHTGWLVKALERADLSCSGQKACSSSVAAAQEPELVGPQLRTREATTGHRVLGDDASRGLLIGCLEDPDSRVDRAERGTGHDQHPVGQQAPEPLGVRRERRPLLVRHGGREVVPRRM
jgi:hypothetical protein